ncbi:hypothetical protein LOK49_LG08G02807 [Camellia lanceoleosa]|uniref:Uncharacterized protein n=1 Tax=Camellia lanceoleosa TaxID=1840588 RepID=A0ACC0GSF6_9ERIC|nr:hypothetical protein LOK49_LG08G02807 [Camellia lanceoleosa]
MSKQHMRNQTEENSKMSPSYHDCAKNPASNLTKGDKVFVDTYSSPLGRISESIKGIELHEYRASQEKKKALSDGIVAELNKAVRRRNGFTVESVSCSRPPRRDNHGSPSRLENVNNCHEDQCGALQVEKVDKNGNISANSIVESISGLPFLRALLLDSPFGTSSASFFASPTDDDVATSFIFSFSYSSSSSSFSSSSSSPIFAFFDSLSSTTVSAASSLCSSLISSLSVFSTVFRGLPLFLGVCCWGSDEPIDVHFAIVWWRMVVVVVLFSSGGGVRLMIDGGGEKKKDVAEME